MSGVKGRTGMNPNSHANLGGKSTGKPHVKKGYKHQTTIVKETLNALSSSTNSKILERIKDGTWEEPLTLLMEWANCPTKPIHIRLDAAKTAALYLHPRAPVQVSVSDTRRAFENIPTEELLEAYNNARVH